ncbi:sulfate permease, SulP family [Pilibacter termitis]|uniref:Sulfate permease, SulP family n=1 Tax=Pilibacter termitis TaxID=263852 RepID=A0A1T4MT46_9ENTE|nr:SulP family inorganic anion transporter [Pilibacter termitis]SJZ70016.1 sulfate permease, SulP family [Pilibacter termitis]
MFQNYQRMLKTEFLSYNKEKLVKDILAGLTTCAVALPLAIAFGVSSGVDASSGLITAVIAGVVISALSGAFFQISGPTGAMAAILIGLLAKFGLNGIFIATLMAGIFLLLAGICRLGTLTTFIPAPVITGFTSGIAIIIALGQIDNFFGVKSHGENSIEKLMSFTELGFSPNITASVMGFFVVLFLVFFPKKWNQRVPASLLAIIICTIVNMIFHLDVASVGKIPTTLLSENRLNPSDVSIAEMKELLTPAISIALLGMIESLLCGASAGRMTGKTLNANQELIAQGVGNIILPFFGGIPATAAIARTSVAIKSGAQTRLTGIFHALGLLFSMLLFSNVMSNIPLCALAGVLMVTAFRMNEWESIRYIFEKKFFGAIALFIITMLATVIFDLSIAIILGFICGLLIFVVRNAVVEIDTQKVDLSRMGKGHHELSGEWEVIYVMGPLFFMSAERLNQVIRKFEQTDGIIFSLRGVSSIDSTILQIFKDTLEEREARGKTTIFASFHENLGKSFERAGFKNVKTEKFFYHSVNEAIEEQL